MKLTIVPLSIAIVLALTAWGFAEPKRDLFGDPLPDGAIARCGTVRFLPDCETWAVALSPDGKTAAVGSMPGSVGENCVELWDVATATRIRTLLSGTNNIVDIRWSPDGRRLAVGHIRRLDVISPIDGKLIVTLPQQDHGHPCDRSIRWSSDGKRLAACHYEGQLCLWDTDSWSIIRSANCNKHLHGIDFSSNGRTVAIAGDGILQVREASDLKARWTRDDFVNEYGARPCRRMVRRSSLGDAAWLQLTQTIANRRRQLIVRVSCNSTTRVPDASWKRGRTAIT